MSIYNFDVFKNVLTPKQIKLNEPMSRHTTFGIGGPADCFLIPHTVEELCVIRKMATEEHIPVFVLGGGANLLVRDKGIRGVVIYTGRLQRVQRDGNYLSAVCGTPTAIVARKAMEYGLSGMEFAAGIPGSIGGAAYMNAGAYGGEMSKIISSAATCDKKGDIIQHTIQEFRYDYRHSFFMQSDEILVAITFHLFPGDKTEILNTMEDLNERRRSKQPLDKRSAGSTFKRPKDHYVGQMIEELGLKGFTMGEAQVSEKHAGFLINKGHATCDEMLKLIHEVQRRVKDKYGVDLQPEVQIIGEK